MDKGGLLRIWTRSREASSRGGLNRVLCKCNANKSAAGIKMLRIPNLPLHIYIGALLFTKEAYLVVMSLQLPALYCAWHSAASSVSSSF